MHETSVHNAELIRPRKGSYLFFHAQPSIVIHEKEENIARNYYM